MFACGDKYDSGVTHPTVVPAQNQSCPLDVGSGNASTLVAVWDPEYGMVTFPGAKLFGPRSTPDAITPQKSQTQRMYSLADSHDNSRTSAFAVYQDVLKDTFQTTLKPPQRFHHKHSHTTASSTRGGLDLYTRDSVLVADQKSIRQIRHFSCLDQLDDDLAFDARLAFSLEELLETERDTITDEVFYAQGKDTTFHLVRQAPTFTFDT